MSPEVRRVFIRAFLSPSLALLAAAAIASVAGVEVSGWWRYAPFAFSLVLFGLPHGAADHLVPGRLYRGKASLYSIAAVFVLYLTFATLYLSVWFVSPGVAFVFFVVLTWFHWGQGDLYFMAALGRDVEAEPNSIKALTVFVRGGMPMLVPLLVFPDVYRSVTFSVVGLFQGGAANLDWVFGPTFRLLAGAGFFLAVLVVILKGYRLAGMKGRYVWRLEVLEVILLAIYFAVVPPILALGLYFCLWHSPRHVARLMLLDLASAAALEKNRPGTALKTFVRDAAPLTLAALALLSGLYFVVPGPIEGVGGLLAVYLALISTLTLPHVAIVCLMDLRQGIW